MQTIINIVLIDAVFDYNAYTDHVHNLTEKQCKL